MALTMNDYQRQALEASVYPDKGTGSPIALADVALSIASDTGAIQTKVARIFREMESDLSTSERANLVADLGRLQWCLAAFAAELGVDLETVAQANLESLDAD